MKCKIFILLLSIVGVRCAKQAPVSPWANLQAGWRCVSFSIEHNTLADKNTFGSNGTDLVHVHRDIGNFVSESNHKMDGFVHTRLSDWNKLEIHELYTSIDALDRPVKFEFRNTIALEQGKVKYDLPSPGTATCLFNSDFSTMRIDEKIMADTIFYHAIRRMAIIK